LCIILKEHKSISDGPLLNVMALRASILLSNHPWFISFRTCTFWTYWPFGPVPFHRIGSLCRSLLNVMALLNVKALRASILLSNHPLNVLALRAGTFSSYWPFVPVLLNVMALQACTFWTYWPFGPVPFHRIGPLCWSLLNVMASRACTFWM
jgi:hypothetical protein